MSTVTSRARAVADLSEGLVMAAVEIAAPPERVFRALASEEICQWWVRPGVFDTREWTGDVRVGGHWRASGLSRGQPYAVEGEFLEVDPPRRLVHTWLLVGAPDPASTVSYVLEPVDGGTRLTLRHSGIGIPAICENTCVAWETSFERLAVMLADERVPSV
jgi:uncharacterized protein YndB with AHSA1/START domain